MTELSKTYSKCFPMEYMWGVIDRIYSRPSNLNAHPYDTHKQAAYEYGWMDQLDAEACVSIAAFAVRHVDKTRAAALADSVKKDIIKQVKVLSKLRVNDCNEYLSALKDVQKYIGKT